MRIKEIAATRIRYGYYRIYILLRREGWTVNHKRVYRLYREEGLSMRVKRPRRQVRAAPRIHCLGRGSPRPRQVQRCRDPHSMTGLETGAGHTTTQIKATNVVYHDRDHASALVLPMVP